MDNPRLPEETICGILRDIYKKTDNDEVKVLARLAVSMAKRMGRRLKFYHDTFNETNNKHRNK